MHEKEKKIKQVQQEVIKELPLLMALEKSSKKPYETSTFRGIKGMQTAIYEVLSELKERDEILAMGIRSSKKEHYNLLWEKWHQERIRKKISCRVIFSDKNTEYFRKFQTMRFTEIKILQGITPSAIDIMKDKVLIFTYGEEPFCVSIYNPEIAQSLRTFFETLWKIAKKRL